MELVSTVELVIAISLRFRVKYPLWAEYSLLRVIRVVTVKRTELKLCLQFFIFGFDWRYPILWLPVDFTAQEVVNLVWKRLKRLIRVVSSTWIFDGCTLARSFTNSRMKMAPSSYFARYVAVDRGRRLSDLLSESALVLFHFDLSFLRCRNVNAILFISMGLGIVKALMPVFCITVSRAIRAPSSASMTRLQATVARLMF